MRNSIEKEEKIKKYRSRRKPLLVWVNEETDEALRKFIAKEYGTIFKGIISYVVEKAILSYIEDPAHKHTSTNSKNCMSSIQKSKIREVFLEIKEYISGKYDINFDEVDECPKVFVEEAIKVIRGSDKRTVKKWLRQLVELRYIEIVDNLVKFLR